MTKEDEDAVLDYVVASVIVVWLMMLMLGGSKSKLGVVVVQRGDNSSPIMGPRLSDKHSITMAERKSNDVACAELV